jgi:hypothetical protein
MCLFDCTELTLQNSCHIRMPVEPECFHYFKVISQKTDVQNAKGGLFLIANCNLKLVKAKEILRLETTRARVRRLFSC